jgi:hypothetical protein
MIAFAPWLLPMKLMNETLMATCEVIPLRTSLMAGGALPAHTSLPSESALMVSEKLSAFGASAASAQSGVLAIQQHWLRAWMGALAGGGWPTLFTAAAHFSPLLAQIATESLAPVHDKVTANALRLGAPALALELAPLG